MLYELNLSKFDEIKEGYLKELEDKKLEDKKMVEYIKLKKIGKPIALGIYETDLNFNLDLKYWLGLENIQEDYLFCKFRLSKDKTWITLQTYKSNYGICDNYEQILGKYPELKSDNKLYVVSMCKIRKIDQPARNGWRWHKWGEYIGKQKPTTEYIYDEEKIEEVYVYHIYRVIPNIKKYIGAIKWLCLKDVNLRHVDIEKIEKINSLNIPNKEKRKLYFK